MKKQQFLQILEHLKTVKQAQSARQYGDCQNRALSLCDFIDDLKRNTQAVTMLVEYCELLFKANQGEPIEKLLSEKLKKIKDTVQTELRPDKIEVIFLPYRAAMFDALESIYLTAAADPACDAYVIPIPYYEININTDKTLGAAHYDGKLFPPNIPVTHWEDYDIETRRPDVIFTHVPYDEIGTNFTIHPHYYHKRLRELCDKVVYVPYFVVGKPSPSIEGFVGTPGPMHAHHTILENEAVRQFYIDYYKEFVKEYNATNYFGNLEEKFLALGSPKYDKIINSKLEDYELPEAWKRIIYKSDGTRKKIIFYNTHWQAWINSPVQYFEKVRHVFDIFRQQDDAVLWWRPHPNSEKNFRTFRPAFLNDYFDIVDSYKKTGWGIYDDTPDLHRAITWSDAYYGDTSSVMHLNLASGKPSMIQRKTSLSAFDSPFVAWIYVYRDNLWVYAWDINVLFSIIDKDLKLLMHSVAEEHDYTLQAWSLYLCPVEANGFICFPPYSANEIKVYEPVTGVLKKIPIDEFEYVNPMFSGGVSYGKYVFFIPDAFSAITRLDTETMTLAYYTDWLDAVKQLTGRVSNIRFNAPTIFNGFIWFSLKNSNIIVSFNATSNKYDIYEIGKMDYRYSGISFDGQNYWLSPFGETKTPLVKWNPKAGILKEITDIYQDNENNYSFFPGLYCCGFIWLFPIFSNHVLKIDTATDKVYVAEDFEADCTEIQGSTEKFQGISCYGNNIYVYKPHSGMLITYDCISGKRSEQMLRYSSELSEKIDFIVKDSFAGGLHAIKTYTDSIYFETNTISLDYFINHVVNESESEKIKARRTLVSQIYNADGKAGEKIYNHFKGEC